MGDGSTDPGRAILQSYASTRQSLRVSRIPYRVRWEAPQHLAWIMSAAAVQLCVHADDPIAPMTVASMARTAAGTGSDVISCRPEKQGKHSRRQQEQCSPAVAWQRASTWIETGRVFTNQLDQAIRDLANADDRRQLRRNETKTEAADHLLAKILLDGPVRAARLLGVPG